MINHFAGLEMIRLFSMFRYFLELTMYPQLYKLCRDNVMPNLKYRFDVFLC